MSRYVTNTSDKSKAIAFLLCCLMGGWHDFYLGKIGSGIIKTCTLNFCLLGTTRDLIKIALGSYRDNVGAPLRG